MDLGAKVKHAIDPLQDYVKEYDAKFEAPTLIKFGVSMNPLSDRQLASFKPKEIARLVYHQGYWYDGKLEGIKDTREYLLMELYVGFEERY